MSTANYVQEGETIDFLNSTESDIAYHEVVPIVSRIGIAGEPIPKGQVGSLMVCGVYECPAESTVAFNIGDKLYWSTTTNVLTKTPDANIPAGFAAAPKATADTVACVQIR